MELKLNNNIFTMSAKQVLYSRLINAKLRTIYIEVDETSTYQEVMKKMRTMIKLDDDMVITLSNIAKS
jgi:hypothetical protein